MNVIITQYKKIVLLAVAVVAMTISSAVFAVCGPCAANAAIKQSIKDVQAALIAAGKTASLETELDEVVIARAPREALEEDPCFVCQAPEGVACDLNCKLQTIYNCCVNTNQQVRCQAREAKKCCKKLHHDIDDVEDEVEDGFSIVELLIVSQIDAAADCCSVLDTNLGDPLSSLAIAIPGCPDVASIVDIINATDIDVIAWLKSLYILLFQVYQCTCTPCIG